MSADISAGRAFVSLYLKTSEFAHGLVNAENRLKVFGKTMAEMGRMFLNITPTGIMRAAANAIDAMGQKMSQVLRDVGDGMTSLGTKATLLGLGLSAAFIKPIKDASDLAETMSKFDIVFGSQAESVKAWGDAYAKSVSRARVEVAGFLAGAQDLFVPLGFAADAAEQMSKEVTKLAFDLASFNNMADADAIRDLQAALTGSGEVMKKYGVLVSEAAVKNQLLSEGIDASKATDQQKVMARWQLILAGTTAAQGDAIRTAAGWANVLKGVFGAITDLSGEIGTALLPVLTPMLAGVRSVIRDITKWITANQGFVRAIAAVAAGLTVFGATVVAIGTGFSVMLAPVVAILGTMAGAFGSVLSVVVPLLTIFSLFGPQIMAIGAAVIGFIGPMITVGGILSVIGSAASFILPPLLAIGVVLAAVAAGAVALAAAAAAGTVALWKLSSPLEALTPLAKAVFDALSKIGGALLKGDFRSAANAAIDGMRQVILRGTQGILKMVQNTLERLPRFINSALTGMSGATSTIASTIGRAFKELGPAVAASFTAISAVANDVFDQLPALAAYAAGRLFRAFVDAGIALGKWWIQSTVDVVSGLVSAVSGLGPKLIKAMFTGNIDGIVRELGRSLAMVGGLAAGVAGAAPEFSLSGESKSAIAALGGEVGTLTGGIIGGVGSEKGAGSAAGGTARRFVTPKIDSTPLENYLSKLNDLEQAFTRGKITPEEYAKGLDQIREKTLGIKPGPIQQFNDRLLMMNAALKDSTMSSEEWHQQLQAAQRDLLGITTPAVEEYAKQLKILQATLALGLIGPDQFVRQTKELQQSLLGIDSTPLDQYAQRVANLRAAFETSDPERLAEELKKLQQETFGLATSPLEQFTEKVKQLQEALNKEHITPEQYAKSFDAAQKAFLGLDPDPIAVYTETVKQLQEALSGEHISQAQFDAGKLAAMPDAAKRAFEDTRTPMEKFKKDVEDLNKMKGILDPETFDRRRAQLEKQLLEDSGVDVKALTDKKGGITSEGTFSAAAAAGMGIGGVSDKGLRAQMEANEILRGIHSEVKKKGGLK